jgi:hypothetical protein
MNSMKQRRTRHWQVAFSTLLACIIVAGCSSSASDVTATEAYSLSLNSAQRGRIEQNIRWLVPSDGKVNGIAHSALVKEGQQAVPLIMEHVFRHPGAFFRVGNDPSEHWLSGTQLNAARVLAEIKAKGVRAELRRAQRNFRLPGLAAEMDRIIESIDKDR